MTTEILFRKSKPKILMVDDKQANIIALQKVLKNVDAELLCANSGNDALKIIVENEITLALLDIQMPEMDGYELAEIIRSNEDTSEIPIIFISAIYTERVHIFKGLELGAFSFMTKPFEPKELITKVEFFIEKYHTTKQLKRALKEVQRANEELKDFIYLTSHDLQEPMLTVISFLQLLEEENGAKLDNSGKEYLDYCNIAAARMKEMITCLLEYLRIGQEVATEEVNLNDLVIDVVGELQGAIKNNNAKVNFSNLPTLKANKVEVKHLMQNLISNAIKFKKPGTEPLIQINAFDTENSWEFEVSDNGIGIEEKHKDKIFQMFKQLHNRGEYEGIGVGLPMCKRIVEKYGGKISLDSEVDKGTTFKFNLIKN